MNYSLTGAVVPIGSLYEGDLYNGDREATQEEIKAHLASIVTALKIAEAKNYLASTDFKMTVDYYATLSEVEQLELTAKRKEAREYIRMNEVA